MSPQPRGPADARAPQRPPPLPTVLAYDSARQWEQRRRRNRGRQRERTFLIVTWSLIGMAAAVWALLVLTQRLGIWDYLDMQQTIRRDSGR